MSFPAATLQWRAGWAPTRSQQHCISSHTPGPELLRPADRTELLRRNSPRGHWLGSRTAELGTEPGHGSYIPAPGLGGEQLRRTLTRIRLPGLAAGLPSPWLGDLIDLSVAIREQLKV
jgi:hypothetical protein